MDSSSSSSTAGKAVTKKSSLFFFSPPVTFLVENTLFRVPREWIEQSDTFSCDVLAEELRIAGSAGLDSDDEFEQIPSVLASKSSIAVKLPLPREELESTPVTASGFEAFLTMLIPLPSNCTFKVGNDSIESRRSKLAKDELLDALRLATAWCFPHVQEQCISYLGNFDLACIERITIAQEFDIPKWLVQEAKRLVLRELPLTTNEVKEIGLELGVQVSTLRETKLKKLLEVAQAFPYAISRISEEERSKVEKDICTEVEQAFAGTGNEHLELPDVEVDAIEVGDDMSAADEPGPSAEETSDANESSVGKATMQHIFHFQSVSKPAHDKPTNEHVPDATTAVKPAVAEQVKAAPLPKLPKAPMKPTVDIKALDSDMKEASAKEVTQLSAFKSAAAKVTEGKKSKQVTLFENAKKAARNWVEAEQAATRAKLAHAAAFRT